MIPIADGSDFGGSLRNPASFCNVVGFRSSPGRVPIWPSKAAWVRIPVQGPLARTVEDAALLMSVMAGPDSRSPIALTEPASLFQQPLERDFKDTRIAWSLDLGELPLDSAVKQAITEQRSVFEAIGCRIEEAYPDLRDAEEIFRTERAWLFELKYGGDLQNHRELIKNTVVFEIENGMRLSGPDIGRAVVKQTDLYHRVQEFMEDYEFLILPVSQVPPFDVNQPYVDEIEGVSLEKYTDWMKSCWYISVTGLPAISVPCGFTEEGLPVGIQIVGRARDDLGVLQMAFAFEQATQCWKRRPAIA
jgi:amidase